MKKMPSVVALSIIILGSAIFSITLVIVCGKRKLSQRKECSRREPHIPGQEAKKALRREIERRIERVAEISYEPRLIPLESDGISSCDFPPYYHRMKAVDNMKYLEEELRRLDGVPVRAVRESIRAYLVNLSTSGTVLSFVEPRLIHELCDQYDHARHHPLPFGVEEFTSYHSLLIKILHSARRKEKAMGKVTSSSGGRAPSDHDSAIDEPDQSGDDENLLVCESSMVILHRPQTLKTTPDDNFETSV